MRDEVLLGCLLSPLAFTNLSAKLRNTISISDASETGGSAAEATYFVHNLGASAAAAGEDRALNFLESVKPSPRLTFFAVQLVS